MNMDRGGFRATDTAPHLWIADQVRNDAGDGVSAVRILP